VPPSPTVVISAAGMARRLGMGRTKALIDVLGRPLIHWHLDLLRDVPDVRVVVGYQAQDVIDTVLAVRRDVIFVYNHAFASTGTAASLCLGSRGVAGDVLSLDGDLLVHPEDLRAFLTEPDPCLGCLPCASTDPVYVTLDGAAGRQRVTGFSRASGDAEWSGLAKVPARWLAAAWLEGGGRGHVFELMARHLPLAARSIRASEIDTNEDYEQALEWMARNRAFWDSDQ
jgi:MobA-like NTP transferase domain